MTLGWCAVHGVLSCLWWEPNESVCWAEPPGFWRSLVKYWGLAYGRYLRGATWDSAWYSVCSNSFPSVMAVRIFFSWVQVLHLILTNICTSTYLFEKWKQRLDPFLCISGSCSCLSPFKSPVWQVWSWVIFLCCWWSSAPVQQTLKEKLNQRKHNEELKPIKIPACFRKKTLASKFVEEPDSFAVRKPKGINIFFQKPSSRSGLDTAIHSPLSELHFLHQDQLATFYRMW